MNWEEAKDNVACIKGFSCWAVIEKIAKYEQKEMFLKQAAELYARAKHDEACEAQIRICAHSANAIVFMGIGVVHKESILQAPKPEFKP